MFKKDTWYMWNANSKQWFNNCKCLVLISKVLYYVDTFIMKKTDIYKIKKGYEYD